MTDLNIPTALELKRAQAVCDAFNLRCPPGTEVLVTVGPNDTLEQTIEQPAVVLPNGFVVTPLSTLGLVNVSAITPIEPKSAIGSDATPSGDDHETEREPTLLAVRTLAQANDETIERMNRMGLGIPPHEILAVRVSHLVETLYGRMAESLEDEEINPSDPRRLALELSLARRYREILERTEANARKAILAQKLQP
jgi:hypothetical protein